MTENEIILKDLDNHLDKLGRISTSSLKKNKDLMKRIYESTNNIPNNMDASIRDLIWCIKNNFNEPILCKTCSKELNLKIERANKNYPNGYLKKYCNLKCFNNDPKNKKISSIKQKEVAKSALEKRKKTIEKKYGSWENRPGKNNFTERRISEELNPTLKKDRIHKMLLGMVKNTGKFTSQNHIINFKNFNDKEFLENNFLENNFLTKLNLEKFKEYFNCSEYTLYNQFDRLGIEYKTSPEDNLVRKHFSNLNQYMNKNFIENNFLDKNNYILLEKFCNYFNCSLSVPYKHLRRLGIDFNVKAKQYSITEKDINSFIQSFGFKTLENNRQLFGKEIDIIIPEIKLGIEYNGDYWHSVGLSNIDSEYVFKNKSLLKLELLEENGFNLLNISQHEYFLKKNIWQSVIKYKLGIVEKKYYARKVELKEVPKNIEKIFLDDNHLQGYVRSDYCFGLFSNGELVSLMSFCRSRFKNTEDYELLRFCNKINTTVVGGASKLFKYFSKNYEFKKILSYANRNFASVHSNLYLSLGFKYLKKTVPNYKYLKNSEIFSRQKFQKHKLVNFSNYSKDKTETQIMLENGYRKLFDCGNLTYIYQKENK